MKHWPPVFLILMFLQCDSPNSSQDDFKWPNHAPVIEDIVVFPGTRSIPYSYDLICAASDQDGDSLIYTWSSLYGEFISVDGYMAYWAADTLGTFTVTCKASDGRAYDKLTRVINVIELF